MPVPSPRLVAVLGALSLLAAAPANAQPPAALDWQAAMARLAWMDGEWKGTMTTLSPDGKTTSRRQVERMGPMMGGTFRMIDGMTFDDSGHVVAEAVGLISYNQASGAYEFRAYRAGNGGTYKVEVGDQSYVWEIGRGDQTSRYTVRVRDGIYTETIELVLPDRRVLKVGELVMHRTGPGVWPQGDLPTPLPQK